MKSRKAKAQTELLIAAVPEELKQSGGADSEVEDKQPENVVQVGFSTSHKVKCSYFPTPLKDIR